MRQKTKNHRNQGSTDKKIRFFRSPYVTYPDGFALCKKSDRKNSHAWAPLKSKKHALFWICMQRTITKFIIVKKFFDFSGIPNKCLTNMSHLLWPLLCSPLLWSSQVTCRGWKRTSDWNRWSLTLATPIFTTQMMLISNMQRVEKNFSLEKVIPIFISQMILTSNMHFCLEPVILCSDHPFIYLPNDPH